MAASDSTGTADAPMRHALPTESLRDLAPAASDGTVTSHQIRYFSTVTWLVAVGSFLTMAVMITHPIIDDAIWLCC